MKKNYLLRLSLMLIFSLSMFLNSADAVNRNWDGGGDGVSWTDPLNWANDMMPGIGDRAVFPSGIGSATITIVQGPGTPSQIDAIWLFNNTNIILDLDLTISGTGDVVRVFMNNTLTFGAGRTFNITGGNRALAYYNNNSTIVIESGATVNLTAPFGVGSNLNAAIATLDNYGTINFTTPNAALRMNTATAMTVTNHPCATMNLGAGQIQLWTSNPSTFTNNGLVTHTGGGAGVSVTVGNSAINNGFYDYYIIT